MNFPESPQNFGVADAAVLLRVAVEVFKYRDREVVTSDKEIWVRLAGNNDSVIVIGDATVDVSIGMASLDVVKLDEGTGLRLGDRA